MYRFVYELETGKVINAQEIKTATIESDDEALFNAFNEGIPLLVMDGFVVKENTEESANA